MKGNRISPVWIWGVLLWAGLLSPAKAQQALHCEDILFASERAFFNARFDEASSGLEACLNAYIFQDQELMRAKILLARIYFAARNLDASKASVAEILEMNPEYRALPPLPPPFIVFVNEIREETFRKAPYADRLKPAPVLKEERAIVKPWVWIGGGALIAGTAAALLSGGSDNGFPPPPGPPGR